MIVNRATKTVSETLAEFLCDRSSEEIPTEVTHEVKRLLLNQLKASVAATDASGVAQLATWSREVLPPSNHSAHVLWYGIEALAERAAFVNACLFMVLDFNETYAPAFLHGAAPVIPPVLAVAEVHRRSGRDALAALALGIEVEIACARILQPSAHARGFMGGVVGGIGAAAACSVLLGLDKGQSANALALAMTTPFGTLASYGTMAMPYIYGLMAVSGMTAADLASRGLDGPRTAFEGAGGMLQAYSGESADKLSMVPLDELGTQWRILENSYKTMPTETISHAPLEAALKVRNRAAGRRIDRMRLHLEKLAVSVATERYERFGTPHSEQEARFDLRYVVAAAWHRGRLTLAELREQTFSDPEILALRSRIELVEDLRREPNDWGAVVEVIYLDGSSDRERVDRFRGSLGNPLTDDELSRLFLDYAEGRLASDRAEAIVDRVWHLEQIRDIREFIALARAEAVD